MFHEEEARPMTSILPSPDEYAELAPSPGSPVKGNATEANFKRRRTLNSKLSQPLEKVAGVILDP